MTTRKRRRGRPRVADPRTERKQIRLTPAQAAEQEAAAEAQGQTWSAWIVDAADLAIARGSTR